jgi:hypothetical protein
MEILDKHNGGAVPVELRVKQVQPVPPHGNRGSIPIDRLVQNG